jgi:hypothetical protein
MTPPPGTDHTLDPPFRPRPSRRSPRPDVSQQLSARRRRVRAIRRWALALTIALFVGLWALIFSQFVSGHVSTTSRSGTSAVSARGSDSASSTVRKVSYGNTGSSGSGNTGSGASGTSDSTSPISPSQS